jgi:hypothetical protein
MGSCGFDPFVAGVVGKIGSDHVRTDHNHVWSMTHNSKIWKTPPPAALRRQEGEKDEGV